MNLNDIPQPPLERRVLSKLDFEDMEISETGEADFIDFSGRTRLTATHREDGQEYDAREETEYFSKMLPVLARMHLDKGEPDFNFKYDGVRYRVAATQGTETTWYTLRRINPQLRELTDFNGLDLFKPHLLEAGRRRGLILVGGGMGSGKSSFLSSLLKEYIKLYGGKAVMIEAPVEYPLEGSYPESGGRIIQSPTHEDQFDQALNNAMRSRSRYIVLGETRTDLVAQTVLRAQNTGQLVLTTVHGGSPAQMLLNLVALAAPHGKTDMAWQQLAEGLQMCVYLERIDGTPAPQAFPLILNALASEQGARAKIRNGNVEGLGDDMNAAVARAQQALRTGGRRF